IYNEAKKNNVSPLLVAAVARAESSFHPTARSHRGAVGVMQLVPRTGRWLGATDLTDPTQNIVAGAKYLAYLSDSLGGNEDHLLQGLLSTRAVSRRRSAPLRSLPRSPTRR